MADMTYWERRKVCKDYYRKCRKGWIDRFRSKRKSKKTDSDSGE